MDSTISRRHYKQHRRTPQPDIRSSVWSILKRAAYGATSTNDVLIRALIGLIFVLKGIKRADRRQIDKAIAVTNWIASHDNAATRMARRALEVGRVGR